MVNAVGTGIDLDLTMLHVSACIFERLNAMITVAATWPRHEVADAHGNSIGELATPELVTDAISAMRWFPAGGAAQFHCGTRHYALTSEVVHAVDDPSFGPLAGSGCPAANSRATSSGAASTGPSPSACASRYRRLIILSPPRRLATRPHPACAPGPARAPRRRPVDLPGAAMLTARPR
jgi:hypothetical protein